LVSLLQERPECKTDYDGHKPDHIASFTVKILCSQSEHQISF
jgi:hypothetical protein